MKKPDIDFGGTTDQVDWYPECGMWGLRNKDALMVAALGGRASSVQGIVRHRLVGHEDMVSAGYSELLNTL